MLTSYPTTSLDFSPNIDPWNLCLAAGWLCQCQKPADIWFFKAWSSSVLTQTDTNSPGVCRPNCPSAHPAQGPSPSWIRNRMFMWSQRGRTGLLAPASRTASTTLPHSNCSLQYLRLPLLKKVHVFSPLLCWESEGTAALSSMLVEILCRSRIDWIKWVQ